MLEQSFLADIVEHPDDDAPRLIYADWLDEQGRPARAEFIRVQIRRASDSSDPRQARRDRWRESELLRQHGDAWRAELPHIMGVEWEAFHRGFVVQAVLFGGETLQRHAEAVFRAAPIQWVKIGSPSLCAPLLQSPYLARLTELNVGRVAAGWCEFGALLLSSPNLGAMRCLLLHGNRSGNALMEQLCKAHLPRLTELYLSDNDLTRHGLDRLAGRDVLPTLQTLDVRDNRLGMGSMSALASWATARSLRTLYAVNAQLGSADAVALASGFPSLRELYVNHNPIGDEGAYALAQGHFPDLFELDVRYGDISDDGLLALARSPCLSHVERMWLGCNPLSRQNTWNELRELLGPRLRV
ncbi:MAG: TIGR02996 domain-containing protein [Planctomycetia bacterium]|nr:TIGR02996 domain-containing protein [Planctomycetia bacterium]